MGFIAAGRSDWRIDPDDPRHRPMWDAMLRFLGRAVAPKLLAAGWSPRAWFAAKLRGGRDHGTDAEGAIARRPSSASDGGGGDGGGGGGAMGAQKSGLPTVVVRNEDLLLSVPRKGDGWRLPFYEAMVMTGPRTVEVQRRRRDGAINGGGGGGGVEGGGGGLCKGVPPGRVEVCGVASMLSNGTELKFFRGHLGDGGDEDEEDGEALDATIEGLKEQRAGYPLEYGYSWVGRVVGCGAGVDAGAWQGALAFAFHPHASSAVLDPAGGSMMAVPPGIAPADAVFLPAVETALAIVHDAHPREGELVVVFGQGLIGLLVTAILATSLGLEVHAVEGNASRAAAALACGAKTVTHPTSDGGGGGDSGGLKALRGKFDVAIEVSGAGAALQGAIASARTGGKVVVASWYGEPINGLRLGTAFHRSHVTLVASQVSELPAGVSGTWTKQRRFARAWELVRRLRPSVLLAPRLVVPLGRIANAYAALDQGTHLTATVAYGLGAGGASMSEGDYVALDPTPRDSRL